MEVITNLSWGWRCPWKPYISGTHVVEEIQNERCCSC